MSTSVLVTIAGVLIAAVGTGLLTGRCVRRPRISLIAWTVGMSAITVALLAQGIGYATSFGAWTFRVIQVSAQLVAPLLLAWGLVEQVARGAAVRFGARLATAAVAAVAGVVLATDPLASVAFTKAWPPASTHYQIIPHYALTLVALVAGVTVLAALAVCAARGRRVPADGPLVIGAAAVAVATLLLIALRFALPSPAYPALCAIAAVVVWVGLSRLGDRALGPAQADRAGNAGAASLDRAAARAEVASEAEGTDGVKRSRGFKGDRGSRGRDDRGSRRGDDRQSREADDRGSRGGDDRRAHRADDGLRDPLARPPAADDFGAPDFPPVGQAPDWRDDPRDWPGHDRPGPDRPSSGRPSPDRPNPARPNPARPGSGRPNPDRPGPDRPGPDRLGRDRHSPGPQGDRPRYQPDRPGSEPATGMFDASLPMLGDLPLPASLTTPQAQPGTGLAVPVTPPHGLIAIYTLLEDKVADFDRAADEVAEQVRAGEPDTLVYVIHTVPQAPMQRIFYEVYRDRAAYEQHEKQPYVQRFVAARRPYVLATNVIELRLKYAKVSPLPQAEAQAAQAQAAQSQAAQAQPQRPASAPNLPAVRNGNGGRPGGSRPNGSHPGDGRQDTPDYPRRDPGYQPRDPGYQREPSYQPRQPSFQPAEPRYQPRDPGQPRREPRYQPADTAYQPREPGYQPRDPGYQPRDPGYYPRDPGDPGYPPREPRYTPREQDDYPPYPSRDREYPSRDREYPSRNQGYPSPVPEYPARGRGTEWSRGPRDPYAEPGDPYPEPGDRYPRPRDQREQRDPRDPRDPYDPPASPRYDRI